MWGCALDPPEASALASAGKERKGYHSTTHSVTLIVWSDC